MVPVQNPVTTTPAVTTPVSSSAPVATPAATPASTPASTPAPVPEKPKITAVVKSAGAKIYQTASSAGVVLSTEKSGARLSVVEDADKAAAKIGTAGKWLSVKGTNGKRGYVDGGLVKKG